MIKLSIISALSNSLGEKYMSTFTLKMIALIFMVIDHIGYYFEGTPILLRIFGRVSYPLFLFCMVWGYHYTKSRRKYLLRLYLMIIFMSLFTFVVDRDFETDYGYGNHNIFLSMFLVGICISTIELFQKDHKKGYIALSTIFAVQLLYFILPNMIPQLKNLSGDLITGIIPNIAVNEYGFEFIALGVLMYFLKEKKEAFCAMYTLFCIYQFSIEMLNGGTAVQCFMIFALPLMLHYNHQKGRSMKYFFYFFYPAHSFLLFYLADYVF